MYQIIYLADVNKYIDRASTSEQRKIVKGLKYLKEYGVKPEVINLKKLRGYEYWELRILGKDNTRIFCSHRGNSIYILHIFRKKSNKTSKRDLELGNKSLQMID